MGVMHKNYELPTIERVETNKQRNQPLIYMHAYTYIRKMKNQSGSLFIVSISHKL